MVIVCFRFYSHSHLYFHIVFEASCVFRLSVVNRVLFMARRETNKKEEKKEDTANNNWRRVEEYFSFQLKQVCVSVRCKRLQERDVVD